MQILPAGACFGFFPFVQPQALSARGVRGSLFSGFQSPPLEQATTGAPDFLLGFLIPASVSMAAQQSIGMLFLSLCTCFFLAFFP